MDKNKAKTAKVIIAKVPKPRKFDLSLAKKDENIRILAALQSLEVNAGWTFLTQLFEKNKEYLAKSIIDKTDEQGNTLSDAQVDVLRMKHAYLNELLQTPSKWIKRLAREAPPDDDLDPYHKEIPRGEERKSE